MSTFIGQTSGMAAGTLASRITGVFRDIALVAAIGTGIFSDTYSVANSVPNIIYILIAGGAINAVFIPGESPPEVSTAIFLIFIFCYFFLVY